MTLLHAEPGPPVGVAAPEASPVGDVLVVDDSAVDRVVAGELLNRCGMTPRFASDGREALRSLDDGLPALILADMQMPGMTGLDLVQAVRRRAPRVPVILMTAFGSEGLAIRALRAGAANYVSKQSMASELRGRLDQVIAASAADRRRSRLMRCLEIHESRYRLENDASLFGPLIESLQASHDGLGLGDETERTRLGIAIEEALSNAMYHGNLELDSKLRQEDERHYYDEADRRRGREPFRSRGIDVHARLDSSGVRVTIRDEGPGFDTSTIDRPIAPEALTRVGGRGLLLIRAFMDEVRHNDKGNEVTLIKQAER